MMVQKIKIVKWLIALMLVQVGPSYGMLKKSDRPLFFKTQASRHSFSIMACLVGLGCVDEIRYRIKKKRDEKKADQLMARIKKSKFFEDGSQDPLTDVNWNKAAPLLQDFVVRNFNNIDYETLRELKGRGMLDAQVHITRLYPLRSIFLGMPWITYLHAKQVVGGKIDTSQHFLLRPDEDYKMERRLGNLNFRYGLNGVILANIEQKNPMDPRKLDWALDDRGSWSDRKTLAAYLIKYWRQVGSKTSDQSVYFSHVGYDDLALLDRAVKDLRKENLKLWEAREKQK